MGCFDRAAELGLLLTRETGSCRGIMKLHNVTVGEQIKTFGSALTPFRTNVITIDGSQETVTVITIRKVFGRQSRKEPVRFTFRDLGERD